MKARKLLTRIAAILLSVAMTVGVLSLAACGADLPQGTGGGNITLSDTSIEVQVGKSKRLTGTIELAGVKLTWSSADETIATVSDTGLVKGVKEGTTTVTVAYGEFSATCEVKVIAPVTVEISKSELALEVGAEETLTATASNNGTVEWSSSDATVAKVENGKVTALKDGTATVYAECAGSRAECAVTVTDSSRSKIVQKAFDAIGVEDMDKMFFYAVDGGRAFEDEMYYSTADKAYHAKFENSGWAWYGFQLFYKKSGIEGANNTVSFKLDSSKAGHITVNGTPIALTEGENAISLDGCTGSLSIQFGLDNGKQSNDITGEVTVTITELAFTPYTPEKLAAPTGLAVTGKTVAITDDANANKAQSYRIVFYAGDVKKGEVTVEKNGTINDGAIADGEYTLAVYAYSTGRYTSSDEYKPDPAITYTVANGGIKYDLEFKAEADITETGKWFYWKDASNIKTAKVENGKLTIDFEGNSGNWYCTQLFYVDSAVDKTKNNKVTFTLNSSAAGHIFVNGNVIEITKANVGKDVEYTVYNIGSGKATVSIQMGNGSSIDIGAATMVFTFGNPIAVEYEKVKLAAPTVAFGENYAYTVTDATNQANTVDGYNLVFYKDNRAVSTVKTTEKTGTLNISVFQSGTYTVKAVALGSGLYANSDESAGVTLEIVNTAGIKYDMETAFGADPAAQNPGKWGVWAGQWDWTEGASNATVTTAKYDNGTITVTFTLTGGANGNAWGLQVNYVNPDYEAGTVYSFDIVSSADVNVQVESGSSTAVRLAANESQHLVGGSDASFYLQVNVGANETITATIVITNVVWANPTTGGNSETPAP